MAELFGLSIAVEELYVGFAGLVDAIKAGKTLHNGSVKPLQGAALLAVQNETFRHRRLAREQLRQLRRLADSPPTLDTASHDLAAETVRTTAQVLADICRLAAQYGQPAPPRQPLPIKTKPAAKAKSMQAPVERNRQAKKTSSSRTRTTQHKPSTPVRSPSDQSSSGPTTPTSPTSPLHRTKQDIIVVEELGFHRDSPIILH